VDDNRIKQRIIGAIVLVSLGVIFIPMILSGGGEQTMPLFGSPIPTKPDNIADIKVLEFENTPTPPETPSEIRSPVDNYSKEDDKPVIQPVKPQAETKEKVKKSSTSDKTATKESKPLKAWAVQVGSFENRKNALALKDKLIKRGFRAFVERIVTQDKTSYRVRVGPEVRRENAENLQKKIEQKMNIKGIVMTHP
jgi:DedD protein